MAYSTHQMKKMCILDKAISSIACFLHVQTDSVIRSIPNATLEFLPHRRAAQFLLPDLHQIYETKLFMIPILMLKNLDRLPCWQMLEIALITLPHQLHFCHLYPNYLNQLPAIRIKRTRKVENEDFSAFFINIYCFLLFCTRYYFDWNKIDCYYLCEIYVWIIIYICMCFYNHLHMGLTTYRWYCIPQFSVV